MKQTAVEWLESQFKIYLPSIHQKGIIEAIEQAKEMEKQQIIDAYYEGKEYGFKEHGEEYYNETFNTK